MVLDEQGSTVVYVAILLAVVIALMGFALDPGRAWLYSARLQAAADAAALAGARQANQEVSLDYHGTILQQRTWVDAPRAEAAAGQTFALNTEWAAGDSDISLSSVSIVIANDRDVTLSARVSMKTIFMRVFGFTTLDWNVAATAQVR